MSSLALLMSWYTMIGRVNVNAKSFALDGCKYLYILRQTILCARIFLKISQNQSPYVV
jgi:hypothetical protein